MNPVYAGAYVYGKTRTELTLDAAGARKKRIRHLPRDEWQDAGASAEVTAGGGIWSQG